MSLILGSGISPIGGHSNPPRYSCLRESMVIIEGAGRLQSAGSQRVGHTGKEPVVVDVCAASFPASLEGGPKSQMSHLLSGGQVSLWIWGIWSHSHRRYIVAN